MFKDKVLICKDCGAEFVFTAGQQAFFLEKGFNNEPSRCPDCRAAKKQQRNHNSRGSYPRKMYRTTCSRCGAVTEVPFEPRGDRPVYCRACYQMRVENYR